MPSGTSTACTWFVSAKRVLIRSPPSAVKPAKYAERMFSYCSRRSCSERGTSGMFSITRLPRSMRSTGTGSAAAATKASSGAASATRMRVVSRSVTVPPPALPAVHVTPGRRGGEIPAATGRPGPRLSSRKRDVRRIFQTRRPATVDGMVKAFSRALAGTSFMWLLLAAAAAWVPNARAEATFRVVDTHPAGERVTLAPNETVYVRVAYTTDEPVRIWARPYFRGAEVRAGSNPSRVHTGSGEALGWFFLFEPGLEVDEIRITAGDGSTAGTRLVATKPVHIVSANRARAAESLPAWAVTLRDEENRLAREDMERRMAEPVGVGSHLLMTTFMFAVLGLGIAGIVLPLRAVRRWQGGWRVAA